MENQKEKILIIDDSKLNINILFDILCHDYEVLTAHSGKDGLKIVREKQPSLVLLDIVMPDIDGYEVCKKIKEDPILHDTLIIFVTSLDEYNNEEKGLQLGAIDYIARPFSTPIVKMRVKNQLELKRHRDFLEKLSSLDGLTGVPNRRQFDVFLNHEWQNAIRAQSPISVIMMDIDYFKNYNDNYGHLAGDDCLKQVAGALNSTKRRAIDILARYGGEEFACIMPRTDLNGAILVANGYRESIEKLSIPHKFSKVSEHITISLGVSSVVPKIGSLPEEFMHTVDDLLYTAKSSGRNRVMSIFNAPCLDQK